METNYLNTFIAIVQSGSFTKAAEQNFLSSTAVMKQANRLEEELGCTLFERSNTGVRLTEKGKVFLEYAKSVIGLTDKVYRACREPDRTARTIRLGTSLLHPAAPFLKTWSRMKDRLPGYRIRMVQISGDDVTGNREYSVLGRDCDVIIGTFDAATTRNLVTAVPLGTYRFGIAVRPDNPLSKRTSLPVEDLKGQRLLMVPHGVSEMNDRLRREIVQSNPGIEIEDTPGRYDLDTFNQAAQENDALINLTPWANIHPDLVTVPLETDIEVEYGILASKRPSDDVADFMEDFRRVTDNGDASRCPD